MFRIKNNTLKIFMVMLVSVLSLCTLTEGAFADPIAPTITPIGKTALTDEDCTLYGVRINYESEKDPTSVEAVYKYETEEETVIVDQEDILMWDLEKRATHNKTLVMVLKLDDTIDVSAIEYVLDNIIVKSGNETWVDLGSETVAGIVNYVGAPDINWAYKNITDEKYVEFKATDDVLITRITDVNDKDRVKIEEKDQGTTVIARYDYTEAEADTTFYVYDIMGGKTTVSIGSINTTYTIAAKNTDGTHVALNMTLPTNAAVTSIKTVDGIDLTDNANIQKVLKGSTYDSQNVISNDYLVATFTDVPEGTTFVNVNYTFNNENYTIPVELGLDLKAPVLVKRNIAVEGDGAITNAAISANTVAYRVYKNEVVVTTEPTVVTKSTRAIIEITDMGSGIAEIMPCTGTDPIVPSGAEHQKFDIRDLPKSIVQYMNLPDDATYIRVIDGIGNIVDIDLNQVPVVADSNALSLTLEKDQHEGYATVVTATYRDRKVGLDRLVKAKIEDAAGVTVTAANKATDGNVNYVKNHDMYETLQTTQTIKDWYKVTEDTTTLKQRQLQGTPEYTLIDAFGNKVEANLNTVLYNKDYIYVDDNGSDKSSSIAVKVHDDRRIKKITAVIDNNPVILEVFETGNNMTVENDDKVYGPIDVSKVYEIGTGTVTEVTVHHYNNDEITQNVQPIPVNGNEINSDRITEDVDTRKLHVKLNETTADSDYDAYVEYGIKKIDYSDGCVIEFYDELPTVVNVHDTGVAVVTDALGYTYQLGGTETDVPNYPWVNA